MKELRKISNRLEVVDFLVKKISQQGSRKTLWLLQGGSSIPLEVAVAKQLISRKLSRHVTITLADERHGLPGHPDSNWQQLSETGFDFEQFNSLPVLEGKDLAETVRSFSRRLSDELDRGDFVLCMAGIGSDGHTMGIKPHSPAVNSRQLVAGYVWDDYPRVTVTRQLIKRSNLVVAYAVGREKSLQISNLRKDISPADQPAQLLKLAPQVIIFNNHLEGKL